MLESSDPHCALAFGFGRVVNLEHPKLRFCVYDIDDASAHADTAANMVNVTEHLQSGQRSWELELVQRKGVIHTSRFQPNSAYNEHFNDRQLRRGRESTLEDAGASDLTIKNHADLDTICFSSQPESGPLGADEVLIKVEAVGMNAKVSAQFLGRRANSDLEFLQDLYVLRGRVDTEGATCSLECAGSVVDCGDSVDRFSPGDRIVALAPGRYSTFLKAPEWACAQLRADEPSTVSCAFELR